jgi:quercetin dioxygenase-like cupin family protein
MVFINAGDTEVAHNHKWSHPTLVAKGSLLVRVNGRETDCPEGSIIYIKAGEMHELVAKVAGTVAYCIHALRGGDQVGDILDPDSIPRGVDPVSVSKGLTND